MQDLFATQMAYTAVKVLLWGLTVLVLILLASRVAGTAKTKDAEGAPLGAGRALMRHKVLILFVVGFAVLGAFAQSMEASYRPKQALETSNPKLEEKIRAETQATPEIVRGDGKLLKEQRKAEAEERRRQMEERRKQNKEAREAFKDLPDAR